MSEDKNKTYQKKLKWVEEEFIAPAFQEYTKNKKAPITMGEFETFVMDLFTSESKVQATSFGCSVDFPNRSVIYIINLSYIDGDTVYIGKHPVCFSYNMPK